MPLDDARLYCHGRVIRARARVSIIYSTNEKPRDFESDAINVLLLSFLFLVFFFPSLSFFSSLIFQISEKRHRDIEYPNGFYTSLLTLITIRIKRRNRKTISTIISFILFLLHFVNSIMHLIYRLGSTF